MRRYTRNKGNYIEANEDDFPQMINRLKKVFGLVNISPCIRTEKNIEDIEKAAIEIMKEKTKNQAIKTFKVESKRADKTFPIKSPGLSRKIGGVILKNFSDLTVDVHKPDTFLYIDIKQKHISIRRG